MIEAEWAISNRVMAASIASHARYAARAAKAVAVASRDTAAAWHTRDTIWEAREVAWDDKYAELAWQMYAFELLLTTEV